MSITIVLASGRLDPQFDLFADSISPQLKPTDQVVFVDQFVEYNPNRVREYSDLVADRFKLTHVAPKPSIWTGKHRKTKRSFADISGFRNTGLIVAKNNYVVFVDDLTAVYPNWLDHHRKAAENGWVFCGSFAKVDRLKVLPDGNIHYTKTIVKDSRADNQPTDEPIKIGANWIFGSNTGMPLEYFMKVNGYDEFCARRGMEDCNFGIRLENAGYRNQMYYNKNCASAEDNRYHYCLSNSIYLEFLKNEIPFRRYKTDDQEDQEKSSFLFKKMEDEERKQLYDLKQYTTIDQKFDLKSERELYKQTGTFRSVENDTFTDYDGQPIEEI